MKGFKMPTYVIKCENKVLLEDSDDGKKFAILVAFHRPHWKIYGLYESREECETIKPFEPEIKVGIVNFDRYEYLDCDVKIVPILGILTPLELERHV